MAADRDRRRRRAWRERRAQASRIAGEQRHAAREQLRWSAWADSGADLPLRETLAETRGAQRMGSPRDWVAYRARGMARSEPGTALRLHWLISSGTVAEVVDEEESGRVRWRLLSSWERFDLRERCDRSPVRDGE